jgi:hypothetical protein
MFGLDQRTTLLSLTAVVLSGWCVYEIYAARAKILSVLAMPFSWLKFPSTKTEADPVEAAKKAFAELQSLLVFAKSDAGCSEMVEHLNAAGQCLFGHRHDAPHPPAPETVA